MRNVKLNLIQEFKKSQKLPLVIILPSDTHAFPHIRYKLYTPSIHHPYHYGTSAKASLFSYKSHMIF